MGGMMKVMTRSIVKLMPQTVDGNAHTRVFIGDSPGNLRYVALLILTDGQLRALGDFMASDPHGGDVYVVPTELPTSEEAEAEAEAEV